MRGHRITVLLCCVAGVVVSCWCLLHGEELLGYWYYRRLCKDEARGGHVLRYDAQGWRRNGIVRYLGTPEGRRVLFASVVDEIGKVSRLKLSAEQPLDVLVTMDAIRGLKYVATWPYRQQGIVPFGQEGALRMFFGWLEAVPEGTTVHLENNDLDCTVQRWKEKPIVRIQGRHRPLGKKLGPADAEDVFDIEDMQELLEKGRRRVRVR